MSKEFEIVEELVVDSTPERIWEAVTNGTTAWMFPTDQWPSGIFVDDWDNRYDGASEHTVFYLHTLGEYLRHFDGLPVAFSDIQGPEASKAPDALGTWLSALGLEDASAGTELELQLPGRGTTAVTLDFRNENFVGLRSKDSLVRIFGRNACGGPVGLTVHDVADGADAQANTAAWQEALDAAYQG